MASPSVRSYASGWMTDKLMLSMDSSIHLQEIVGDFVDEDVAGHGVLGVVESGEEEIHAPVVIQIFHEEIKGLTHRSVDNSHLDLITGTGETPTILKRSCKSQRQ